MLWFITLPRPRCSPGFPQGLLENQGLSSCVVRAMLLFLFLAASCSMICAARRWSGTVHLLSHVNEYQPMLQVSLVMYLTSSHVSNQTRKLTLKHLYLSRVSGVVASGTIPNPKHRMTNLQARLVRTGTDHSFA